MSHNARLARDFAGVVKGIDPGERPATVEELKDLYVDYRASRREQISKGKFPAVKLDSPGTIVFKLKEMRCIYGKRNGRLHYHKTNLDAIPDSAYPYESTMAQHIGDQTSHFMRVRITSPQKLFNTALSQRQGAGTVDGVPVMRPNDQPLTVVGNVQRVGEPSREYGSLYLTRLEPVNRASEFTVTPMVRGGVGKKMELRDRIEFSVTCAPKHVGMLRLYLIFEFECERRNGHHRETVVNKHVEKIMFSVVDAATAANLAEFAHILMPVAPYVRKQKKVQDEPVEIVEGVRPPRPNRAAFVNALPFYDVPPSIRSQLAAPSSHAQRAKIIPKLSHTSFTDHFSVLLHVENIQMDEDIRNYDMEAAELRGGSMLELKVPGLADKRPSVLYGDRVYATKLQSADRRKYVGYVHSVEKDGVLLRFAPQFHQAFIPGMKFAIQFTFSRTSIRRCHRALDLLKSFSTLAGPSATALLFPSAMDALTSSVTEMTISPAQQRLSTEAARSIATAGLNQEQEMAVERIVRRSHGDVPFVVFGPPGTGKTRTIVEAIIAVAKNKPGIKILAMAPSNSAADLIVQRLKSHFSRSQMFRLNAYQRPKADCPDDVMNYSKYIKASGHFDMPPIAQLALYQIIVCTFISAAWLHDVGVGSRARHFEFICVDEAGHATEPEFWCAVTPFLPHSPSHQRETPVGQKFPQIVIAGDPKQLGPVIRSPLATSEGLGISYLERLTSTCGAYQHKGANADAGAYMYPNCIVKLLKNYRSHPAILRIPNERFYGGELQPFADVSMRESLCNWSKLPVRGTPILFHALKGQDYQEQSSPSWFNPMEATQVFNYVEALKTDGRRLGIDLSQVGVITPYNKQVQKIKTLLQAKGCPCEVGSVEKFQGQERRVIIISTVRSNVEYISHDLKFNLGFLRNPKRFNVAVTRAQALLIVIGDPDVLCHDAHWNALIRHCHELGAYIGPAPPPPSDESNGVLSTTAQESQELRIVAKALASMGLAAAASDASRTVEIGAVQTTFIGNRADEAQDHEEVAYIATSEREWGSFER
ncbi:Helicase MOV-10 [Gonapodya sp. JEL0774]|nr:Helicase MOV-10 [Gonapodya sp. JEL0774]